VTEHIIEGVVQHGGYDPDCEYCVKLVGAMVNRGTIEQAKGMVMQARGIDADAAFNVIRHRARRTHRPVVELAAAIVAREWVL
jgi:AmiR/NasT family two-component response regulator